MKTNIEILSELRAQFNCFDEVEEPCYRALSDAICALSAQPQRKKGKWIKISPANIYECSECGKNVMTDDISAYDFCHGCGADMRGECDD